MAFVLSSVSGNLISAASAGFAPTNSADVSAIASAYQVVSSTATQLYAGTAYLTSVNETPISASRAGNAANASLATSAYYDGTGRLISSLPDEATVSSIASTYAESAASSKQDTLTFDWDSDSAISSINGSALAGQGGGGASIPFVGNYYDSAASATSAITADVSSISSVAYYRYNGNVVNTYKSIIDSMGLTHLGIASFIDPGAEINGKSTGGIPYTMSFAPPASMWTTADAATGIFAPLQYGTGAGMFLNSNTFKGYLKGNEWFVSNTLYGYARGEVHQSRGSRVIVEHTGGAGAVLSAKNQDANVTLNSTAYGTAKMAVTNSQSYVQVQRGNSTYKYNSAKLDTDYLKFYNGMTTGYLDPEDTASGTAYMPAQTEYIYISSIPYWNAKLDASAIECDTASAITAIGGSSIGGGGVDSATVSAIASGYAESAASGKLDSSASSSFYTTANESGFLTSLPTDVTARNLSAYGHVRATATGQDLYGNFDYAGMYFRSGSTRPYNIGIDNTGTNFYIATAKNGFERIYASSIQSWNGKQDSSAMTAYVEKTAYDNLYSAFTALSDIISTYSAYFSSISAKVDNSAIGVIE